MLDIKFIRENPEVVKTALKNRNVEFDLDYLLTLDEKRRGKIKEVDDLRAKQNQVSDTITSLEGEEKEKKIAESKELKTKLGDVKFELKAMEEEFIAQIVIEYNPLTGKFNLNSNLSDEVITTGMLEKAKESFKEKRQLDRIRDLHGKGNGIIMQGLEVR